MIEKHLIFLFFILIFLECNVKNINQDIFNKIFIISFIAINNIYIITKYSSIITPFEPNNKIDNEYSDWILCDVD